MAVTALATRKYLPTEAQLAPHFITSLLMQIVKANLQTTHPLFSTGSRRLTLPQRIIPHSSQYRFSGTFPQTPGAMAPPKSLGQALDYFTITILVFSPALKRYLPSNHEANAHPVHVTDARKLFQTARLSSLSLRAKAC